MRHSCLILTLLGVSAAPLSAETMRPEIRGRHGIVAAGRHYSVEAGMRLFRDGGNAVDAGVAAVLAASVCEISHFGFGGESPILVYDPRSKETVVINGQGPAPRIASYEMFLDAPQVPGNGPLGATVPAMLDAVALALERYGTKSLGDVLAPAIELADGFAMYAFLQHYLVSEKEASMAYPSTARAYYPEGRVPEVGEVFRQPDLAKTLRAIADAEARSLESGASREEGIRAGRDRFYKGEIGRRIAEAVESDGGLMRYDDLAGYEGRFETPAKTTFHEYTVLKAGPWNQGPVLLQTLNLLEGFDLREMGHGSTRYIHTVTEAIKLAYDDRDSYYGDPDFVRVPISGLLSKDYAAERRALDRSLRSLRGTPPRRPLRLRPRRRAARRGLPARDGDGARSRGRRHDVRERRRRDRPALLGDAELRLAPRRSVYRGGHGRSHEQPHAGFRRRSTKPERRRRRQAAAHDANADYHSPCGRALPRHQHAGWRYAGPTDPQRAPGSHPVRHGSPGSGGSAAHQFAAHVLHLWCPPGRPARTRGRKPHRSWRRRGAAGEGTQNPAPRTFWYLDGHHRRRCGPDNGNAPRRRRRSQRALHLRLVRRSSPKGWPQGGLAPP